MDGPRRLTRNYYVDRYRTLLNSEMTRLRFSNEESCMIRVDLWRAYTGMTRTLRDFKEMIAKIDELEDIVRRRVDEEMFTDSEWQNIKDDKAGL